MNPIFSTAYLPPIEYFYFLSRENEISIEAAENYQKQSFRNRTLISSANGIQQLSIPIVQNHQKMPIKEVQIDYKTAWQRNHWKSITAAYNNSPFFLYYQDFLQPFYEKKIPFLLDYNTELLRVLLKLLKMETTIVFTEEFAEDWGAGILDLRAQIHPKRACNEGVTLRPYTQTFATEAAALPHLSVLDLLCNAGDTWRQIFS